MDYWLQEALDYADKWIDENKEFAEAALRNWETTTEDQK